MNRARWITSAAIFLVLWLVGALILAPTLRRTLEQAAKETLSRPPADARRLARIEVSFEGQHARAAGKVRSEADRAAAIATLRDHVRAPVPWSGSLGLSLNPVASVSDYIQVAPFPPGWLMLAATGAEARLLGSTAHEFEARDLARSIQNVWSNNGGRVEGMPEVDPEGHDEAPNVATSLRGLPRPQTAPALHAARIGGVWRPLPLGDSDESLRAQTAVLGVTDNEWRRLVLPALRQVRDAQARQRQEAAEKQRLAALPPGHLFIAARDAEVTLRGELGSEAMKRDVLDEALIIFAPLRVHDEIRVSSRRRPGVDFAPLSTALLPPRKGKADKTKDQAKALFLGFDHEAWTAVDWQVSSDAEPWKNQLPSGLDATLLKADSAAVIDWLQGATKPAPPAHVRPAFLTLALFEGRAILGGQVAEEATRTQVIAAARRAYAPAFLVQHDQLQVEAACRPFRSLLNTLKSLPPPPRGQEGVFAIAAPAESWNILPVTDALVEAGGLGRSGQLSATLPATLVESRSQEALEHLREWRSRLHSQPGFR